MACKTFYKNAQQTRVVKFMQTESIGLLPGARGRGEWGVKCLTGTEFRFCEMKKVLEIDDGDGCTKI